MNDWKESLTTKRALYSLRGWLYLPAFAKLPRGQFRGQDSTDAYWLTIAELKCFTVFEKPDITEDEALDYVLRLFPDLNPDDTAMPFRYTIRESVNMMVQDALDGNAQFDREDEEFYKRRNGFIAVDFENADIRPAQASAVEYLLCNEETVMNSVVAALLDHFVQSDDIHFVGEPSSDYVTRRYSCQRVFSPVRDRDGMGYLELSLAIPDKEEETAIKVITHGERVEDVVLTGETDEWSDAPSWVHTKLGLFRRRILWAKTIVLPEYSVFCYQNNRDADEITLACEPDPDAIEVLDEFWNERPTPEQILNGLWAAYFDSGKWWSDEGDWHLDVPRPSSAAELIDHLDLQSIWVIHFPEVAGEPIKNPFTGEMVPIDPRQIKRPGFWAIELSFRASFETEHGIGLLWHRGQFIGDGYGAGCTTPPKDYDPAA